MSIATTSQLRHILMKILPAPEMVAQGKTFCISNHLDMVRDSLWIINSFLMDGDFGALKQPDVSEWMKDVSVAVEDVYSLLSRILNYWEPSEEDEAKKKSKIKNFFHISVNNNIESTSSRGAILVELKDIACLLNYLVNRGAAFALRVEMMDSMDPSNADYSAILCEEVIARDENEDQIIELLQQEQCDEDGNIPFIVAITGGQGSGKTTLARKIYHHPWVRQHFQHRIWLDVSYPDINMIGKEIARSLTGEPCTSVDCWPLINEHLGGDRYLLILDNVFVGDFVKHKWEELNLNLLHCGAPGSKVIFAGYSCLGYRIKFNVKEYELKGVPEDGWVRILLRYAAFVHPREEGNNNIHKEKDIDILIPLAKKCSQEYDGNLLVAKGVGLMFKWTGKNQWQQLANELYHRDRPFSELQDITWELLNFVSPEAIRFLLYNIYFQELSYDITFISLAEGATIYKISLLEGGIILGISLDEVKLRFITNPCFFKMKVGDGSRIPPECRHVYLFIDSKNITKSKKAIEEAGVDNKLRTLVLDWKDKKGHINQKGTRIFESLFLNFKRLCTLHMKGLPIQNLPSSVATLHCLRYLNLAYSKIETLPEWLCNLSNLCVLILSLCKKLKELPRQIHKLRKLQVLNLKGCLRVQKLPGSITRLVNLKFLDVSYCCWLSKFPDDLSNMKNLTYLNMRGCVSLTRMPSGIGQLTNLELIWGYDAIDSLENVMLSELQALTNLESLNLQHLERLESAKEKDFIPATCLQENQLLKQLTLRWEWWNEMAAEGSSELTLQFIEGLQRNLAELMTLQVLSYMSKKLPSWLMTEGVSVLNKLCIVHLINLKRCERLPPLGQLPELEKVEISGFDSVREVDEAFYGKSNRFGFCQLQSLVFSEMPRLEKWLGMNNIGNHDLFPKLEELTLIQCPKLREFRVQLPTSSQLKLKFWLSNEILMPTSKFNYLWNLEEINMLQIFGCQELRNLPNAIRKIHNLKTLTIMNCNKLEALPIWLKKLHLESLCVYGCSALSVIPKGLKVKGRLRNLIVKACPKLQSQKYLTDDEEVFY